MHALILNEVQTQCSHKAGAAQIFSLTHGSLVSHMSSFCGGAGLLCRDGQAPRQRARKSQTHTRTKAVDLAPYTVILRDAINSFPGSQAYLCEIYSYVVAWCTRARAHAHTHAHTHTHTHAHIHIHTSNSLVSLLVLPSIAVQPGIQLTRVCVSHPTTYALYYYRYIRTIVQSNARMPAAHADSVCDKAPTQPVLCVTHRYLEKNFPCFQVLEQ